MCISTGMVENISLCEVTSLPEALIQLMCTASEKVRIDEARSQNDIFHKHLIKNISRSDDIVTILQDIITDVHQESRGVQQTLLMHGLCSRRKIFLSRLSKGMYMYKIKTPSLH